MSVERSAFQQVLAGTARTLSVQFYRDGAPVDPGDVTVTITNDAGETLVSDAATSGTDDGPRSYVLTPAQTNQLDVLTVQWSGEIDGVPQSPPPTHVEVVGDYLFTLSEARNFDKALLADAGKYPDAYIESARAAITESFEQICDVSFIPRYAREILDGDGGCELILPHLEVQRVRSIEVWTGEQWEPWLENELAQVVVDGSGVLYSRGRNFACDRRNIRVSYEHGYRRAPQQIRLAALRVLQVRHPQRGIDDRAVFFSNQQGQWRISVPGEHEHAYFGIPEVDGTLMHFRRMKVSIG